jgi:hypothetical protein
VCSAQRRRLPRQLSVWWGVCRVGVVPCPRAQVHAVQRLGAGVYHSACFGCWCVSLSKQQWTAWLYNDPTTGRAAGLAVPLFLMRTCQCTPACGAIFLMRAPGSNNGHSCYYTLWPQGDANY